MRRPRVARSYALAVAIWLLLGPLSLSIALSAVTIAGFEVEAGEQAINVYWETASETDNLGFYLWRSEQSDTGYVKLPTGAPESEQFIPSDDLGFGAFYEFMDEQVTPGVLYYYKLQDYPVSGSPIFVGPESAGIGLTVDTDTPTPTSTSTPSDNATPTPTASPLPSGSTPTPEPSVQFWAEETTLDAGACTTVQWTTSNVQAVFFDGASATGQGARTFCPCESETHALRVTYQDGTSETFTVALSVTGTCEDSSTSPLTTPTLRATATPSPTAAPAATLRASTTATTQPAAHNTAAVNNPATATPIVRPTRVDETASPSATPTGDSSVAKSIAGTETADEMPTGSSPDNGVVVEGRPTSQSSSTVLVLLLASIVGVGLVALGIWQWRRG